VVLLWLLAGRPMPQAQRRHAMHLV
jgi:hypothetical protein